MFATLEQAGIKIICCLGNLNLSDALKTQKLRADHFLLKIHRLYATKKQRV